MDVLGGIGPDIMQGAIADNRDDINSENADDSTFELDDPLLHNSMQVRLNVEQQINNLDQQRRQREQQQ